MKIQTVHLLTGSDVAYTRLSIDQEQELFVQIKTIFVLEAPQDQNHGLEDYITPNRFLQLKCCHEKFSNVASSEFVCIPKNCANKFILCNAITNNRNK